MKENSSKTVMSPYSNKKTSINADKQVNKQSTLSLSSYKSNKQMETLKNNELSSHFTSL